MLYYFGIYQSLPKKEAGHQGCLRACTAGEQEDGYADPGPTGNQGCTAV